MADYMTADDVRAQLTTKAAKAAFEKINELGPQWLGDRHADRIYLDATIEKKAKGSVILAGVGGFAAKSFDEAVTNILTKLESDADRNIIVVNAYGADRAEFVYDAKSDDFRPYGL